MNAKDALSSVPNRVYLGVFVALAIGSLLYAHVFYSEARLLDGKIVSRQIELARIVRLKNTYLSKKSLFQQTPVKKAEKFPFTLAAVEEIVSKTFVSGKLTGLKPSAAKEEKSKSGTSITIEVKVKGATLSEVITFVKAVESSGMLAKKLQLTLPQNQTLIDVDMVIGEG